MKDVEIRMGHKDNRALVLLLLIDILSFFYVIHAYHIASASPQPTLQDYTIKGKGLLEMSILLLVALP